MSKPIKHHSSWRIRWTDEHGIRQSQTFDSYKDAEFILKQKELEVEEVKRGLRSPRIANKSFLDLCDYWIDKRIPLKRNGDADTSIIKCHLKPFFGKMGLRSIGVAQIDDFKASRQHLDQKTISNHLTLLISMLNVAVELRWLEQSPKIKKPKTMLFNSDFRYLKSKEEIERFLRSAHKQGEHAFCLYTLAIHTGLRQGEIAGLKKSSINFDKRLIIVQNSFSGPTKAGDVRYVPILTPLLPILRNWYLRTSGDVLFPNEAGKMHQPSARIFQEVLHTILKDAGFPTVIIKGKEHRYIRFHDLRHTFASTWVMNNGDIFKLQKILGHKSMQMTMRYSHLTPDAFSGDYGRFGDDPLRTEEGLLFKLPS